MPKTIVICCDGTGNEIGETISNVLKLYRILEKSERQRVYYNPGVGTIGEQNDWQRVTRQARGVFGLATGYGLDHDVVAAYRFLCDTYAEGDKVCLFGFSRGAYTVRVLAAFLNVIGLMRPDQSNLIDYALTAYKRSSARHQAGADRDGDEEAAGPEPLLEAAWHFGQVAGAKPVRIAFMGVWDTVASIIVPRSDTWLPDLQTLRYTRRNPSVAVFRQAMAIDERRRLFRLNAWRDPQFYRADPYVASSEVAQDIRQVWFAGVHADIGGGYPEIESGLSKFPLLWMVEEAVAHGLRVNHSMVDHLVLGQTRKGSRHDYVAPNTAGDLHDSMNAGWEVLEWIPKSVKRREWSDRPSVAGWYLPRGEPRVIKDGARIHQSVVDRMAQVPSYRPINLPARYRVEPLMKPRCRPPVGAASQPLARKGPMQFDPEVLTLFEAIKAAGLPPISWLTPAEARVQYRQGTARLGGAPVEMAAVRDLAAEGPAGPIPLRLYRPRGAPERDAPALVYYHGGGWVNGDLDTHDRVCRQIADRAGCLVVAVDYRLAPEHPAPAPALDAIAALRWIADHAEALGADRGRLAVGGDSAGGSLSAVVALAVRDTGPALRSQILIYPSVDNRADPPSYPSRSDNRDVPPLTPDVLLWFSSKYMPDATLRADWRQSPIAAADHRGLPPALVIVAERDPLYSEGLAYADRLEAAGVEVARLDVPGMIHGFITMYGTLSAAGRATEAIAVELKKRFATSP